MRRLPSSILYAKPREWLPLLWRYVASWWYMVFLGAMALVMAFSPSTYNRRNRVITSRYLYSSTWAVLPWFTLLAALVSLVIIRIVVVTAQSYGLSRYALEMVVRVLVLELIPLTAAMFVSIRAGLAFTGGDALAVAAAAEPDTTRAAQNRLRADLVPQVIANAFAVLSLAMVSSVIVLVLAYLSVYGFSPWGVGDYTRTVGRIFDPAVTIGFVLKTVFFGLAVAVIPTAAILDIHRTGRRVVSTVQPGAVRLLFVLLLIEASSLAVKYI
jgi:phospholipid/cholesterol/gamma-HCH transport system permease protein